MLVVPLKAIWARLPEIFEVQVTAQDVPDAGPLTASVSRSLDLTGSNWGLRKKTQIQTYRKTGVRWVWHS
jgi:hypothetical protein